MVEKIVYLEARPSDAALVSAAIQGDQQAKETLFRRHVKLAAGVAYRLLGNDEDVDDVVQEAFLAAFAKLGDLKSPQAFGAWLASIVTGIAIGTIRKRQLLSRLGLRSATQVRLESFVAADAPADVVAELRAVYEVIQSLPVDERVMLILKRVEELTLDQIAERTGWSVATIKRRLARAEARLNAHMELK